MTKQFVVNNDELYNLVRDYVRMKENLLENEWRRLDVRFGIDNESNAVTALVIVAEEDDLPF